MPENTKTLIESLIGLAPVALISVLGGFLDYVHAIQSGKRVWSFASFLLHLAFSVFCGYLMALAVIGAGYTVETAGAAAGAAGFLNIKLIDLIVSFIKRGRIKND